MRKHIVIILIFSFQLLNSQDALFTCNFDGYLGYTNGLIARINDESFIMYNKTETSEEIIRYNSKLGKVYSIQTATLKANQLKTESFDSPPYIYYNKEKGVIIHFERITDDSAGWMGFIYDGETGKVITSSKILTNADKYEFSFLVVSPNKKYFAFWEYIEKQKVLRSKVFDNTFNELFSIEIPYAEDEFANETFISDNGKFIATRINNKKNYQYYDVYVNGNKTQSVNIKEGFQKNDYLLTENVDLGNDIQLIVGMQYKGNDLTSLNLYKFNIETGKISKSSEVPLSKSILKELEKKCPKENIKSSNMGYSLDYMFRNVLLKGDTILIILEEQYSTSGNNTTINSEKGNSISGGIYTGKMIVFAFNSQGMNIWSTVIKKFAYVLNFRHRANGYEVDGHSSMSNLHSINWLSDKYLNTLSVESGMSSQELYYRKIDLNDGTLSAPIKLFATEDKRIMYNSNYFCKLTPNLIVLNTIKGTNKPWSNLMYLQTIKFNP